jgi:UTP--glucose-1-phosphate uridylyltransferase
VGRYVLPPEIFPILANTKPGKGGEIQLTDALSTLCANDGLYGVKLRGERFDAGDRSGYVLAVLRYALRRADIGAAVRAGAEKLLRET